MSGPVIAVVPHSLEFEDGDGQPGELVRYTSLAGLEAAFRRPAVGYILVVDEALESQGEAVAGVVRSAGVPVIEVRPQRWNGTGHSPIAAACRGTIAGFAIGPAIREARAVLTPPAG